MKALAYFTKLYSYLRWKDYFDTFIIIAGAEGSGKSSLALSLAAYLDPSFKEDMQKRILLNPETDIKLYYNFLERRARLREKYFKPPLEVILVDEGQNFFFSRNAMTKEQKRLIQVVRTQRFTLSTIIICLPNLLELEKPILERADIILLPDREEEKVYGYFKKFKNHYGHLQEFIYSLYDFKYKQPVFNNPLHLIELTNVQPDFYAKPIMDKELYLEYEKVKILKARQLLEELGINKQQQEEEKKDLPIEEYEYPEFFDNATPKIYINCYYTLKAISRQLGIPESTLKTKLKGLPRKKIGKKYYYPMQDVLRRLNFL